MQLHSMVTYAQSLQDALIMSEPNLYWDAGEALTRIPARGFRLSQKDHWENNGILDYLLGWSSTSSSVLWVGGSCGNQDSWITEMSLDIAHVLLSHRVSIVYIFCSDFTEAPLTPTRLVKILVSQLLEMHPEVPYENTTYFSLTRIRNTTTFTGVWQIFERLVMSVGEVFILIDKVEACTVDDSADLKTDLLPSISRLVDKAPGTRGIITSVYEAPKNHQIEQVYVDTARRPAINRA